MEFAFIKDLTPPSRIIANIGEHGTQTLTLVTLGIALKQVGAI
jgi:hypothetical protein